MVVPYPMPCSLQLMPLLLAIARHSFNKNSCCTLAVTYCYQNLPRDMALSHALDTSVFEMVWLPEEPPEPDVEVM